MKKLAARRLLLDGCMAAVALKGMTPVMASNVVISTPAGAHAFHDDAPFVFSGQALVVDYGFSTERMITLTRLAPIFVGEGVSFALEGPVSADAPPISAPLEKRGLGELALLGANSYTSNTVLREGLLRMGGGSPLGHIAFNLQQHAGTVLEFEPGLVLKNHVQVMATRPGDVALAGLDGIVEWRVRDGQATMVSDVTTSLPIRKTGAGTLRMSGVVNGLTPLYVEGGALALDGTSGGKVYVSGGARLEGRGRFAGAHVSPGGMVAPGGRDAIGKLYTWGDVQFEPGSIYHVNVEPGVAANTGAADLFEIMGKARLDGWVWAEAGAGEWLPEQRHVILSAQGGFDDSRYAGVDANLAFLDPALEYDASHVYLTLRRNDLTVGGVGGTPDEQDVGDAIDPPQPPVQSDPKPAPQPQPPPASEPDAQPGPAMQPPPGPPPAPDLDSSPLPDPDSPSLPATEGVPASPPQASTPLQQAMLGMTPAQARSALRQMTGGWHASVRSFLMEDSRYVRQAVLAGAPAPDAVRTGGLRGWAQPFAATGRRSAVDGVDADRHDTHGLVLGMDAPVSPYWRVGGVVAAREARLRRGGWGEPASASASIRSLDAGAVLHATRPGLHMTLGLLHAWHRISSRRLVSAGPLQNLLGATVHGRSWQVFMEITPRLRPLAEWLGGLSRPAAAAGSEGRKGWQHRLSMGPSMQHARVRLRVPGFQEAGGDAAHRVEPSTTGMHVTTLGWRLKRDFEWAAAGIGVQADVGWRRVWGNTALTSAQSFAVQGGRAAGGAPRIFASHGQPLRRNALALGVAVDATPWRNARLSARYGGLYARGLRDHATWLSVDWRF